MLASLKRPTKMGGTLTFPFIRGGEMGYTWGLYLTSAPAHGKYLPNINLCLPDLHHSQPLIARCLTPAAAEELCEPGSVLLDTGPPYSRQENISLADLHSRKPHLTSICSIYISIHLSPSSVHLLCQPALSVWSVHPPTTQQPTHPSLHLSICLSVPPSVPQSINQSIYE